MKHDGLIKELRLENIYKMMNLESFNPEEQIIREIDTIQNLDTQYRSIPQIGQLFSELSYSSLLKHDRETNRTESKPLPEKFKNLISSSVTFVDIPLNEDNSIYKVNKLFYSSYHTYCAILVSEIIKYFDSVNSNKNWTIGLIAPYKAQAILLNKLITSYVSPPPTPSCVQENSNGYLLLWNLKIQVNRKLCRHI